MSTIFIEPLDVLYLRGNKLFGEAGSYGEALLPPWPSVVAGAIRSRMLADAQLDLAEFGRNEIAHPQLGTPEQPGSFRITGFHFARRRSNGQMENLYPLPSDLLVLENDAKEIIIRKLSPVAQPNNGIQTSTVFDMLPVLAETKRRKPLTGYWLNDAGWQICLQGQVPTSKHLVRTAELWSYDQRVGVGLNADTRHAEEGHLFSMQAVAFKPDVGFVCTITGATPPEYGTLRFGGDGRAAAISAIPAVKPVIDVDQILQTRCCRLILTTPGIFTQGWLPNGAKQAANGEIVFDLYDVTGKIHCASVPRAEVISGWNMAKSEPKPAQRVAPTGSIYWLMLDETVTAKSLDKLAESGLWSESCEDISRRAEGFNLLTIAAF